MYTAEQLKETALKRGYATVPDIQLWIANNPKVIYTEDDLLEVYRFADRKSWKEQIGPMRHTAEERKQMKRDSWL